MKNIGCVIALLTAALATAQGPNAGLTEDVKRQTLGDLEKYLTDAYAFPEIAKKAVASLQGHAKNHDYDAISDGPTFAKQVTKDLNEVCHDAHLHLAFSEEALPKRKESSVPSAAEIKAAQERTRFLNAGFSKVERMDGNIGYLAFRSFSDPSQVKRPLEAAMQFLANTDSLIIDIRENGGGDPETVQLICSYFFGDKPVHLNDLVSRDGSREQFWTLKKVDGPRYLNKDIYILTSKRTGSAAEEFTYDLKNLKRATVIGEPTWGGANPGDFYRLNDHFLAFIPNMHAENPITHDNWEGKGVIPDIAVKPADGLSLAYRAALQKEIGKTTDVQLKAALERLLKEQTDTKGQ